MKIRYRRAGREWEGMVPEAVELSDGSEVPINDPADLMRRRDQAYFGAVTGTLVMTEQILLEIRKASAAPALLEALEGLGVIADDGLCFCPERVSGYNVRATHDHTDPCLKARAAIAEATGEKSLPLEGIPDDSTV